MDHCFPADIRLVRAERKGRLVPPNVMLSAEPMNTSYIDKTQWRSEITDWFCRFLRSIFNCDLHKKAKLSEKSDSDQEIVEGCYICIHKVIENHISSTCDGAYLDDASLDWHKSHMQDYPSKSNLKLHITKGKEKKIILAHYNPEGVYFNVFPITEGKFYFMMLVV